MFISKIKTFTSSSVLTGALVLTGCTTEEPNNPPPVASAGNTNPTATGGMGDDGSGGMDDGSTGNGETSGADVTGDPTESGTGGDICDPDIIRHYCAGKVYWAYCNPSDGDQCYIGPFGEGGPRWCALPPGQSAVGDAKGIELTICSTVGAEAEEMNNLCTAALENVDPDSVNVPTEMEVLDGEGQWPLKKFYIPWGESDPFSNVASGSCTTNALPPAVPDVDKNGMNVPCNLDECGGLEKSCNHELDGLRSYTRGSNVYTRMPLTLLDELRMDSTSLQYCEAPHGGYNLYYNAFGIPSRSHLAYKMGFRDSDVPLEIRGGGQVYSINGSGDFLNAFEDIRTNVFPLGTDVNLTMLVDRGGRTTSIQIKTY